ncbi:fumarylacetoacetate hydrolase family protein [Chitinilyticum piscinae]|uniref:Fumarylacetoacetate hydrolase family protein n=1 Tax=Chitinilyticum piscinae TaxID=2866724 RepID=A0A8J7FFP7_9NEIS|nr:fumarylacetoacetate hydrolase family protein [Chitinilyticum piscinae]MBE9608523.1 fumarylacetoacetate hydrolase family protein [Chitinilyticum piscinae]
MPDIRIADRELRVANIFCVGRNYLEHAKEMGSSIGAEPMVFLKPSSALVQGEAPLVLPQWSSEVHHETELVVAIGRGGRDIPVEEALSHVAGYALGLDLTARDVQAAAKKAGNPWTLAKGFAGAAPVSDFIAADTIRDPQALEFTLQRNGELKQHAQTADMAFGIATLIAWISARFGLQEGDLIFTGTPEGVGPIVSGDVLELSLPGLIQKTFRVA